STIVQIFAELFACTFYVKNHALPAKWSLALDENPPIRDNAGKIWIVAYFGWDTLMAQPPRQIKFEHRIPSQVRIGRFLLRIWWAIKDGVKLLSQRSRGESWQSA